MTPLSQTNPEWDELKREFNAACLQASQSARVQISHELNQLFRRLRQYEKESEWVQLVMEGAGNYARHPALFAVQGLNLQLRGSTNLDLPPDLVLDSKAAAAFEAVLRSKEAVTALRTEREVGPALSNPGQLAYLFPILNGSRVAAILFAGGDNPEVDQLELVSNMASSALERHSNAGIHSQIVAAASPPMPQALPARRLPDWAHLAKDDRTLHSQAAQFARTAAAVMQLAHPVACRQARQSGDLYVLLGKEIDKARDTYRQRFMVLPSIADYLHRELVDSILDGDSSKLGADYPGELA